MQVPLFKHLAAKLALLILPAAAACAQKSELYCSQTQPCTAGHAFCDIEGICEASGYIGNTCIPQPCWDAGGVDAAALADASRTDAPASSDGGVNDPDACAPAACTASDCTTRCGTTTPCIAGCGLSFVQTFMPSDSPIASRFGKSVATDGDRVVVGAPGRGPNLQGGAYLYEYDGIKWSETILTPAAPVNDAEVGYSVAIDGDRIVLGKLGVETVPPKVYVLSWTGGAWTETSLVASNDPSASYFGQSVAIDGDRIVVGAPGVNAAYVYEFNGSTWVEEILEPGSAAPNDEFGSSVAVSGDTVLIGAPASASGRGSAYVFEYSGGMWQRLELLPAGTLNGPQEYGASVAIQLGRAVIGVPGRASETGGAYVFERLALNQWSDTPLLASTGTQGDRMGHSVTLDRDWLAVGAPTMGAEAGHAYTFPRADGSWHQRDVPPQGSPVAFGHDVGISGYRLVITEGGQDAAHLYELQAP